jgi:hypothetical protein
MPLPARVEVSLRFTTNQALSILANSADASARGRR